MWYEIIFLNNQDKGYAKCCMHHSDEWKARMGVCLECGKKGHFVKACHSSQGNTPIPRSGQSKIAHTQVYALVVEENDAQEK